MYLKIKRIFDILLSLILIVILFPLFIIISLILIMYGMNPIYKQKRSGKDNKVFILYKFRTMKNNEINSFCNFLRKTGIDELLQLFNILKGDMSFIGPRPWMVEYSKYFNKKQMKRLNVLPGLTGLTQISQLTNVFDKINNDIYYVEHLSFKLDAYIVLNTIKVVLSGKKTDFSNGHINEEIELLACQVGEI